MAEKEKELPRELSSELKDKYVLKNGTVPALCTVPLHHPNGEISGWETVDFRTMTAQEADELIARGCQQIEKKEKAAESTKPPKSATTNP